MSLFYNTTDDHVNMVTVDECDDECICSRWSLFGLEGEVLLTAFLNNIT